MISKNLGKVTGKSAYEIAVDNGFEGTEKEWLESLKIGADDIITDEQIQEAINNYFEENPVEGITEIENGSITVEKLASSVEPKMINLVKDVKFEDITNTNNFFFQYVSAKSVADGVLTIQKDDNGSFNVNIKSDTTVAGNKYYCAIEVKINNPTDTNSNAISIGIGSSARQNVEIKEGYQRFYKIVSGAITQINVSRALSDLNTDGISIDIRNPIIVDLTETFGAGNEPQVETFNALMESVYDLSQFKKELPLNQYILEDLNNRVINVPVKNYAASEAETNTTGDGSLKYVIKSFRPYAANLGTFKHYVGVKVKCSKPCNFRLFNSSSFSEDILNSEGYSNEYAQTLRETTIEKIQNAESDTEYYLYGTINKAVASSGASRSIAVIAEFNSKEDANEAVLTISNLVCINLTECFGKGFEPDAETVFSLLGKFENHFFSEDINIFNNQLISTSNHRKLNSEFYDGYVELTDNKNVRIGGDVKPDWSGWQYPQNSYGNSNKLCPIPTEFHGKIVTDAQVSVVPLYGHWGRKAVTTGGAMWGGHVFHGWNDAQTYRLTMMASGGMSAGTVENFAPREDEFCIHVFSPTGAFANPIGITEEESANRITRAVDDQFSSDAYFGRIRIGTDKADGGFLFRQKSLTCFGRLDINGNDFFLGDQSNNVPKTSTSSGYQGQITYDENYFYICVAPNTWKRFTLESW